MRQRCLNVINRQGYCSHLFGVFEILEQRGLVPVYALVDVGGGVRETFDLPAFTPEQSLQSRMLLYTSWESTTGRRHTHAD